MSRHTLSEEERQQRADMKTAFRSLKVRPITFTVYFVCFDRHRNRVHGEFDIIEDMARGRQRVGNDLRDVLERLNTFEMPFGATRNWVYNGTRDVMRRQWIRHRGISRYAMKHDKSPE